MVDLFELAEINAERNEQIIDVLKKFFAQLGGVIFASVVSMEGLPIVHYPPQLPTEVDDTRVAAMTAAMLSLGERAMMEVGSGSLVRIFVEGDDGYLISTSAGETAVLTINVRKTVKLGLIFHDLATAARAVGELLG
jgi:predicted regulator of Ras-like GTPase activity (Roadblock/LC7/MglB family)